MRDNELIINVCADISSQLRKCLIQLIEAGAPIDLCQDVMCALRNLENAPSILSTDMGIDHSRMAHPSDSFTPHFVYSVPTAQELKEITAFFIGMQRLDKDPMPTIISKYPTINPSVIQDLYNDFMNVLSSKDEP